MKNKSYRRNASIYCSKFIKVATLGFCGFHVGFEANVCHCKMRETQGCLCED